MNRINLYLFFLTNKYLIFNFIIISLFIFFINLLELSRVIPEENKNLFNYLYLSFLKYPSILNEIIPFVTIISISFLIRNLINNNELISMRNLGYSIFDIFLPIAVSVFITGLIFLILVNPISTIMASKYEDKIDKRDINLHSIKITNNEMWIKNKIDDQNFSFINIKNIDLQDMTVRNIKILLISDQSNTFILAENGEFRENIFSLNNVKYYNFLDENFNDLESLELKINFNKENIINSISEYKLIPFYKYIKHTQTLNKFNLYSKEIGLYYLSEVLKPIFIVVLAFVIIGFTSKFQRNENFFKVLFIAISIGFIIFLLKEIISKLTISLSMNIYVSYLVIFLIPLFIGLYQVIKIENE